MSLSSLISRLDDRVGLPVRDGNGGGNDRILLLDAHKNASVVFSRALAGQDIDIVAGGWSRLSPGMLSRRVDGRFLYPSPYRHPDRFLDELMQHLRANRYLAVVPLSDLSHVLLAKNKQRIEETGTAVGTESWEPFVSANNKKSLAELVADLSVNSPYTEVPSSVEDVPELKDEFTYPVLIKPQYTTVMTEDGTYIESKISERNYVHHPDQLADSYRSFLEKHPYYAEDLPLIQEAISGDVIATCGVAEDGAFLKYFQEERLRMFPVDGGASALRHGIHDPGMAEDAKEIVAALGWTGPIYIEFIRPREGSCYVLEVNGRYWGSVGCAIRGGVNVPLLHYRQMKGISSPSDQPWTYQLGHKQRRLFYTDIKWLIARLKSGNVGALRPFVISFFDADHDLLAVDDPLPVAGATLWAIQEILQRNGPTSSLGDVIPDLTAKVFGFPRGVCE